MKRLITAIAAAALLLTSIPASAQLDKLAARESVIELETESNIFEIFTMEIEGQNHYYLSLGKTGLGNHFIQVNIDPVSEMFVLLGDTIDEAIETMSTFKAWFKEPLGKVGQVQGCISMFMPEKDTEPLDVITGKFLLTRYMEFSVEREGVVVASNIHKDEIGSLLTSLKIERKLRPNKK